MKEEIIIIMAAFIKRYYQMRQRQLMVPNIWTSSRSLLGYRLRGDSNPYTTLHSSECSNQSVTTYQWKSDGMERYDELREGITTEWKDRMN